MASIVVLIIVIFIILSVFLYFFVLEDKRTVQEFLEKFRKNKTKLIEKKTMIDTSLFQNGLSEVHFHNDVLKKVKTEIAKKIVWMENFINSVIVNLLCGWHILVEWFPGLAKTKTIHTFADIMGMIFKRIQFTPDMLPSDIIGVEIYNSASKEFETKMWPIVANIILADEINRSTPKVQSALLEAMEEQQVTIWWKTVKLPEPFFVLATQNPLEQEWTYPLPEAQIDRFLFKILVDYPTLLEEKKVMDVVEDEENIHIQKVLSNHDFEELKTGVEKVTMSDSVKEYITRLVQKTRPGSSSAGEKNSNILYGSSPRWSIGLMLAAKALAFVEWKEYVSHEDVQKVALSVLRHRIVLSYDAKISWLTEDEVLLGLFGEVGLMG